MGIAPSDTPPDWRRWVERELSEVQKELDYLMHPETGIHASLRRAEDRLRSWAIAIMTLLIMNLVGIIIALTLIDGVSVPG